MVASCHLARGRGSCVREVVVLMAPDTCPLYNLAHRGNWDTLAAHSMNMYLLLTGCTVHICGSPTSHTLVRHLAGNGRALNVSELAVPASLVGIRDYRG